MYFLSQNNFAGISIFLGKWKQTPNTEDLKLSLRTISVISNPVEVNTPFCISSVSDFLLVKSKSDLHLLKLGREMGNLDSKIHLTTAKFPVSTYEPAESLKVDQMTVFKNSSHAQKCDIALTSSIFPDCVLKNTQVKKAQLAPENRGYPPLIASL